MAGADEAVATHKQVLHTVTRAGVAITKALSPLHQMLAVRRGRRHASVYVRKFYMNDWRIRFGPILTPIMRTWWRISRRMTLGVRVICQDDEGRVLLVRHSYAKGWHLPGGGVESRETAEHAAVRELAEEAGAEAIGPLQLFGFYANHANFPNDHIAVYIAKSWRPCAPLATQEIAERNWFAPDALPDGTTGGTKRRLAEIFDNAPQSATW